VARDTPSDREGGVSHRQGALLFPVVGVVAGLTAFMAFYLFWPSVRAAVTARGGTSANGLQAQTSVQTDATTAVRELAANAGDGAAAVSWKAPSGMQAVRYSVQAIPENTALSVAQCATTTLSCVVSGLTDGATYTVEVSAVNAAGQATASTQTQVTPYPAVLTSTASVLWLKAAGLSAAVGTPVSQWPDQSSQHNSATQPTRAAQPLTAMLGSRPALKFSGAQSLVLDGGRLPSGSTPSEVFAVVELQDPDAATSCFEHVIAWGSAKTGAARMLYKGCQNQLAYADTFNTYSLMRPMTQLPQGQPTLLTAAFSSTGDTVRVDGATDYSWPAPTDIAFNTRSSRTAMVGGAAWWGAKDGWIGLIGEVVVLSGRVSADDERAVERYLIRKWGVPTP
jgi:hypothetical protein